MKTSNLPTVKVLGYPLASTDLTGAANWMLARTRDTHSDPVLVVTLNPEIVVRAENDSEFRAALGQADLTVADGVGLLWAARREGFLLPGRVPGVELAMRVMELAGPGLSVYFLGGRPGIADRAAAEAFRLWGTVIAGSHHGYFDRSEEAAVTQAIRESEPDLLLAGLGEDQEAFLARNRRTLGARLLMGVGGTLDVLAGEAVRTPAWTRKLYLEWAWRVGLDRRRWHRVPRLVRFVRLVLNRTSRRSAHHGSG